MYVTCVCSWEADAPRIERASMSGDYRSIVFKVGQMGEGAWPNGLTLDYTKNRIYWVDARLDSIHTIKYDGSDFRTILSDHEALSHPFAISVFESNLYWTDWRSNSVMRANKFTGGNVTTIQKTYTQPFDVKIFHPSRQPRSMKNESIFYGTRTKNMYALTNYDYFVQTSKIHVEEIMEAAVIYVSSI